MASTRRSWSSLAFLRISWRTRRLRSSVSAPAAGAVVVMAELIGRPSSRSAARLAAGLAPCRADDHGGSISEHKFWYDGARGPCAAWRILTADPGGRRPHH